MEHLFQQPGWSSLATCVSLAHRCSLEGEEFLAAAFLTDDWCVSCAISTRFRNAKVAQQNIQLRATQAQQARICWLLSSVEGRLENLTKQQNVPLTQSLLRQYTAYYMNTEHYEANLHGTQQLNLQTKHNA